jgi:hypothetical protein
MYALGSWYDPLVSAATGAVQQVATGAGTSIAAGAAPELKVAVVAAVREVLPDVKRALSSALSDGATAIAKKNQTAFIGMGLVIGFFTLGSLTIMLAQYRRLGKCCPTK